MTVTTRMALPSLHADISASGLSGAKEIPRKGLGRSVSDGPGATWRRLQYDAASGVRAEVRGDTAFVPQEQSRKSKDSRKQSRAGLLTLCFSMTGTDRQSFGGPGSAGALFFSRRASLLFSTPISWARRLLRSLCEDMIVEK